MRRRPDGDGGSATLELVVLTPAFLLMISAAIIGMRIQVAGGAVEAAAYDAARTASISRDAGTASTRAHTTAQQTLAQQGLVCGLLTVTVDTSGFSVPVGQPATVQATVTCVVDLADVAFPGVPGSKTMTATFVSPLDRFRARQ